MRCLPSALAAVLAGVTVAHAQEATTRRAFTPADWYRVSTVSSPALSPDGKLVAFTVTTVMERENKRHSEVWVVPAVGGDPVRYTAPGTESSNPRFSADGKYLLFSSNRPGGKGNTWALRMDGRGGEAFQLDTVPPTGSMPRDRRFTVRAEGDRSDSAATSDSSARRNDPFARMAATARPPYGSITRPLDPQRFDGKHVTETRYKANGMGFVPQPREARRTPKPAQIWIYPADGSAKRQVTNAVYSHRNVTVSPDGKWIAFTADAQFRPDSVVQAERDSLAKLPYDSVRDEAPRNNTDIFVIPTTGGEPRRITNVMGDEGDLSWSPDGKQIAFVSRPTRTKSERLYVVSAQGGTPENIIGDWQYEPDWYEWLPSGSIIMGSSIGGRSALFNVSPKTKAMKEILGGRRRLSGFATDDARTKVAYVSTSLTQPTELYIADVDGRNERKLTRFNDKLNTQIAWADAERFTYQSVGGLEIEGWLMKPYGYQSGKKYPLVLYIHGGPHSAYGENWFDEFQNLAGAGMWVLFTNPRGSSGYGADFTYSTRGRWGAEDYEDLMKAVDIAAKRADVDSTRMGVTGGSYGGFMTAWITTKTNRFKAAQTDRMIANWTSWYGASDAQGLTEFEFYGKPWENPALYDSLSPIKYVERVKTPTLMVQSEEDYRTPMAEAEQWFMSLRKRDVPVEWVRYPRSNHDLSRTGEPWLLVDRLGRLRQWFTHWLTEPTQAAAAKVSTQ